MDSSSKPGTVCNPIIIDDEPTIDQIGSAINPIIIPNELIQLDSNKLLEDLPKLISQAYPIRNLILKYHRIAQTSGIIRKALCNEIAVINIMHMNTNKLRFHKPEITG